MERSDIWLSCSRSTRFEFANKYKLEIIRVVSDKNNELTEAYTGDGKIINSDFLNGLSIKDAKEKL